MSTVVHALITTGVVVDRGGAEGGGVRRKILAWRDADAHGRDERKRSFFVTRLVTRIERGSENTRTKTVMSAQQSCLIQG